MAEYLVIDAHVHTYQTREVGLQAKQGSNITDYAGTLDEPFIIGGHRHLRTVSKQVHVSIYGALASYKCWAKETKYDVFP